MTNYEKIISSIMLSTVLSKTLAVNDGSGCFGCNCGCDDNDEEEIPIIKKVDYNSIPNKIDINNDQFYINNTLKKEFIIEKYPTLNNSNFSNDPYQKEIQSSNFYQKYQQSIEQIIESNNYTTLLQIFLIEKQIFDPQNKEYTNNEDFDIKKDITEINFYMIESLYNKFKNQYQNKIQNELNYDFSIDAKNDIEDLDFSLQLSIVSILMHLLDTIATEDISITEFSNQCLYHNIKIAHNKKTKDLKEDSTKFIIKKKSALKPIICKIRNQIFISLFNYIIDYLDLCYEKFGDGFWIKTSNIESNILKFLDNKSDKDKTIKEFFDNQKIFGTYTLYSNVCDMTFEDIIYMREKIKELPNFEEVFTKEKNLYKINSDKIEEFKKYFSFTVSEDQSLTKHQQNINNFFKTIAKNNNIEETPENISFKFNGLEAPTFTLFKNSLSDNEEEEK